MSVLTDLYLAEPDYAKDYDVDQSWPEVDRAQYKSITTLELSTLTAIIQRRKWDVAMIDEFPQIMIVDGGERLIFEIPRSAMERFASLSEAEVRLAADGWSKTEEIGCEAEDIQPVVEDIVRLSKRGCDTKQGLYLWICV